MSCQGCGKNKLILYPKPTVASNKLLLEVDRFMRIMFINSDRLKAAPKPPTGFRVTEIVDDTTILVEWHPLLTPFDYYRAYAYNTFTDEIDAIVDKIQTEHVDIRGLKEDTLYRLWVVSVRDNIESEHSNYDYARTYPSG